MIMCLILKKETRYFLCAFFLLVQISLPSAAKEMLGDDKVVTVILNELLTGATGDLKDKIGVLATVDRCEALFIEGVSISKGLLASPRLEGIEKLERSTRCGNIYAARVLADLYEKGEIVDADINKAKKWKEFGAKKGDPVLMMNYALHVINMDSGPDQIKEEVEAAERYLIKVASLRKSFSAYAYYKLGRLYSDGNPFVVDDDCRALSSFRSSLELGYAEAAKAYGDLRLKSQCQSDKGVEPDR